MHSPPQRGPASDAHLSPPAFICGRLREKGAGKATPSPTAVISSKGPLEPSALWSKTLPQLLPPGPRGQMCHPITVQVLSHKWVQQLAIARPEIAWLGVAEPRFGLGASISKTQACVAKWGPLREKTCQGVHPAILPQWCGSSPPPPCPPLAVFDFRAAPALGRQGARFCATCAAGWRVWVGSIRETRPSTPWGVPLQACGLLLF